MSPIVRRGFVCLFFLSAVFVKGETLRVEAISEADGKPLPCRVHLIGPDGKPVKVTSQVSWNDHFVCEGMAEVRVPAGRYKVVVERGPEYQPATAEVEVPGGGEAQVSLKLHRIVDMASEGWHGGELHAHRKPEEMPLLMRAEDLRVASVISWWNEQDPWEKRPLPADPLVRTEDGRFFHVMGGEDERGGGAILIANLPRPIKITGSKREYPSSVSFLHRAAGLGAMIDIEKPFWWDTPLWLATGKVRTVGIANNHMNRSGMYEDEAWGKPRDATRLPPPLGNGYWTQELYYHVLSSGLRIAPSAGSASGVLPNPLGYNRVYVKVEGELTYEKWWRGLIEGRSFITNGPLLRVKANGQWPGYEFSSSGGPVAIGLEAELQSADPIRVIQVVRDGEVVRECTPDELKKGGLGNLTFDRSGWFLVRAMADVGHTFRFATTAPFYVRVGEEPRISAASVEFFLQWIGERRKQLEKALPDEGQRGEVMKYVDEAEAFWSERLKRANAD